MTTNAAPLPPRSVDRRPGGAPTLGGAALTPAFRQTPGFVWTVIVVGVLCMLTAAAVAAGQPLPAVWQLLLAGALCLIGETAMLDIRFGHNRKAFTMSEAAIVVGLVLVPSPWLVILAPIAVAGAHAIAHRAAVKIAFNALSCAGGVVLARVAYAALADGGDSLLAQTVSLTVGALAFFVWNSLTMAGAVALSQGLRFGDVYAKGLPLCLLVWAGNVGTGLLLVSLASSRSPFLLVVPLLLALLYFMYWSWLRAMNERDVWQVLQATTRELLRVEPADVAQVVLTRTPALFSAEFVELLLVGEESADAATVFRWNGTADRSEVHETDLRQSNPFWGRMLAEREPFEIVGDDAPAAQRRELASLSLVKCVVAPLIIQDRCLGTLRIGFRGDVRFRDRDMRVLTTFANHVSTAMHNTRLFETVRRQSLVDPLTGLANRTLLIDRMRQAQARSRRTAKSVAVMFLDLDRFKVINDSMGHEAGDQLLVAVAERISAGLRAGDTAARFGGDEFVVLCESVSGPYEALSLAERLVTSLTAPFTVRDQPVVVSASVGVALGGPDDEPTDLLRDADAAMYQAKERGPARCELFDSRMRERAVDRLELENDLRVAIGRGELHLDYQPNIRLSDDGIIGVEALVRWLHPQRGEIGPADFIPLAEETGLIVSIGAWVTETACRQLAEWTADLPPGAEPMYVSINVSPLQLTHPGLVSHVATVLRSTGVDPRLVCMEITESALVDDLPRAREVLERLRGLGVRIALDDFGTGYSSLSYLHQLPVDVVKLDRSFIGRLHPEARGRAVVAGMVELAHAMDLTVVAEGVETEGQLLDLRALDCDVVQGFHFYRPLSPTALEPALADRGSTPAAIVLTAAV